MDIADLIASFSTLASTYSVTRRAAATYVAGRAVAGATSAVQITASVQPATGRDLLRLPEGRRALETRVLFTTTQLFAGEQGGVNEADQVTIEGIVWEVQHVEEWVDAMTLTDGFRCVAQRREGVG